MAFNPFKVFRKHQKVMFAGLTIIIMLLFVFTYSGAGGRWDQFFVGLFTKGPNSTEVAKVYGSKVSEQELMDLAAKRSAALSIWFDTNEQAMSVVQSKQSDLRNRKQSDPTLDLDAEIRSLEQEQKWLEATFRYLVGRSRMELLIDTFRQMRSLRLESSSLELYMQLRTRQLVFENRLSAEGLLDFLVWGRQAEKLGITLSDDDVGRLFNKEASFSRIKLNEMIEGLRKDQRYARFKAEDLKAALGEEFRVRLAQEALWSGQEQGDSIERMPVSVSSYDFWEYFRKNRTRLRVAVLPIPVDAFVSEVKEKPTENDLESLFNAYRDRVASPASDKPGFKEPRRLEIEWLTVNDSDPSYRQLAALASLFPTPNPLVNGAQAVGYEFLLRQLYESKLQTSINERDRFRAPEPSDPSAAVAYDYFARDPGPEQVATMLGQFASSTPPLPVLATVAAMGAAGERAAFAQQDFERRSAAMTEVKTGLALAAINPVLGNLAALPLFVGEQLAFEQNYHKSARGLYFFPFPVVRDEMEAEFRKKEVASIKQARLQELEKDLASLKSKTETDAPSFVAEVLEKHRLYGLSAKSLDELRKDGVPDAVVEKLSKIKGQYSRSRESFLKQIAAVLSADEIKGLEDKLVKHADKIDPIDHGKSEKPRDFYEIQSEPGLKRLAPAKSEPGDFSFADSFFNDQSKLFQVSRRDVGTGAERETFLVWKTLDQEERIPKFEEAKPKVAAAWRLIQARKKAEKAAEALKKDYPADAERNLKDELAKLKIEHKDGSWQDVFVLPEKSIVASSYEVRRTQGISLLEFHGSTDMMSAGQWGPTVPPKADILYPPDDFAEDLVKNLTKVGESMVIHDKSLSHYYVVTLLERSPPTETDFADEVTNDWHGGGLWNYMEQQRIDQYRKDVLKQLRHDAGLTDEEGEPRYTLNDAFRKKLTGVVQNR
jgi:hypothetical protein